MTNSQSKDISDYIDFHRLDPELQETLLGETGDLLLRSSMLKLHISLTDEQVEALDHYLEDEPSGDLLMQHLFEHYPQFENILKEEMEAFRDEVIAVLPIDEDESGEVK